VCAPPELLGAVKTVKQFLTYVNAGPFQHAIATGLGLPGSVLRGLCKRIAKEMSVVSVGEPAEVRQLEGGAR